MTTRPDHLRASLHADEPSPQMVLEAKSYVPRGPRGSLDASGSFGMGLKSTFAYRTEKVLNRLELANEAGVDVLQALEDRRLLLRAKRRVRFTGERLGMVWHCQGSGKTESLVFLARLTADVCDPEVLFTSVERTALPARSEHGMRLLRGLAERHVNLLGPPPRPAGTSNASLIRPGGLYRSRLRRLVRAQSRSAAWTSIMPSNQVVARYVASGDSVAWATPPVPPAPPGRQVACRRHRPRGPNPRTCHLSVGVVAA